MSNGTPPHSVSVPLEPARPSKARFVSAKAAIAARADYFHGEFIGDKLVADFKKRIESVNRNKKNTANGNVSPGCRFLPTQK